MRRKCNSPDDLPSAASAQPYIQQEALLKPSRLDLGFGGTALSFRHDLLAGVARATAPLSWSLSALSTLSSCYNGADYPASADPDDLVYLSGAAWLFRRGALGTWKQEAFLKAPILEEWGLFGFHIEVVNPNMVLVGQPFSKIPVEGVQLCPLNKTDEGLLTASGSVTVFGTKKNKNGGDMRHTKKKKNPGIVL